MRKHWFLWLVILSLFIFGCSHSSALECDLVLEDLNTKFFFKIEEQDRMFINLLKTENKDFNLKDNGFLIYDVFENEDEIFAKTRINGKMESFLVKTSKETFNTEYIKLSDTGYKMGIDSDFIYHMYCYPENVKIEVFNKNLDFLQTYFLKIDDLMLMPQGLEEYNGYLWMLCGAVNREDWNSGSKTLLLKLNQKFEIQETLDLNIDNGSARDMCIVNGKVYYTKTTNGVSPEGYALGDSVIGEFDLVTYDHISDKFHLEFEYPFSIDYIPELYQLMITHDHTQTGGFIRSFINLENGAVTSIQFPKELGKDDRDALFSVYGKYYLFLFASDIVILDSKTFQYSVQNLEMYGFDGSGAIIVKKENL